MEHRVQSSSLLNPRKPLLWIVGAALVAVVFASGALAARAFGDDEDGPAKEPGLVIPGIAKGGEGSVPIGVPAPYGPNDVATDGGRGGANTVPYPGCRAPLPVGVLANGTIDFSKAVFAPSLPKAGFSALGVSFSAQGECDKDGKAINGDLVLDTSWLHDSSGIDAYVSQRKTDKKQANVMRPDSAVLWADGYLYTVGVNIYRALPASAADGSGPTPVRDGSASSGFAGGSAPGYAPQIDPRAAQVLAELIAQVAPSVDQKCVWTLGAGDWSSLAAAGIGDPRPAIPSGYSEAGMSVTSFTAPPAGCDTSLKPTDGFSFNASWQKDGTNGNDVAYLGVSVYANPVATPGQLSDYGANWSNGSFQLAVYAKANKPVGLDTIRAIAKALDPTFDEKCFIQQRELKESELDGLGFHAAKAPSGYSLQRTSLQGTEIAAGCPKPEGFESSYNLNWSFQNGADNIQAGANRYGGQGKGDGSGFQSPNSLNWTDASGTNYFVNGSSSGISPNVSKDDLVFVAKSMDPAFDLKKLQEGGGPKDLVPPVAPQPAPDKPR